MPDQYPCLCFSAEEKIDIIKILLAIAVGVDSPEKILRAINHLRRTERREAHDQKWCAGWITFLTQFGHIQQQANSDRFYLTKSGEKYLRDALHGALPDLLITARQQFRHLSAS